MNTSEKLLEAEFTKIAIAEGLAWPDGTPRSTDNCFSLQQQAPVVEVESTAPLTKKERDKIYQRKYAAAHYIPAAKRASLKAMATRVNATSDIATTKQHRSALDKNNAIRGGGKWTRA